MTPFDPRLMVIASAAKVKTCHVHHCWHALKQLGEHFQPAHFAYFSGLEERHVTAILEALESHNAAPKAKSTITDKGRRLSSDFVAPQDWIDWAIDERMWTPEDAMAEAENFRDFWHAKPGAAAVKLDWRATWRNWVRNSRRPDGDYRRDRGVMVSHTAHMEKTAALYERMGRTTEAQEIRRRLAAESNVISFGRSDEKIAQFGG